MSKRKRLIKFKDMYSKQPVYVNIDDIFSISKYSNPSYDANNNMITGDGTNITSVNGHSIIVQEHITEVIAIIEERDVLPAKVLFSQKQSG